MASLPTPIASNANGAPVATRASVRSSMNVGALEFTMCLAPMAFRTSTCSCLRTMFTSPMPGEELVNATVVAGGVEEERRPDRSALAARAVGVGRVGRTARGDRGAERVLSQPRRRGALWGGDLRPDHARACPGQRRISVQALPAVVHAGRPPAAEGRAIRPRGPAHEDHRLRRLLREWPVHDRALLHN